jgi:hypothetical protein
LFLELKTRGKRSNDSNNRYINDDTDLRSTIKNRSSSRHLSQTSHNDDREYLLDKDYRQPSVFDMLLSIISPDNNNKKLKDNYDIQQMDIVDDYPLIPPLPPHPPPQPPLPPNHLPFFDPLPPLPPPPPSLFNIFPVNQSFQTTNWPRPNFVQTDLWHPTDVDLRHQPITNHHHTITEQLSHKKPRQQRRKRSKKPHHHERESESLTAVTNHIETLQEQSNNIKEDDDEEERLLREELLRTLTNKRKVKIIEPERIVTIIPSNSPPPTTTIVQTNVNPTPIVVDKPQYSINQRYKRVKANVSLTNVTNKTETTTGVLRTTQPVFQTRNKIVRAVKDFHSIIFTFFFFLSLKLILICLNQIQL